MSTKTLRKRIALVAVSALGFGLVSSAPSNAAWSAGDLLYISTSANGTGTATVGRVNTYAVTLSGVAGAATDDAVVTLTATSVPVNSAVTVGNAQAYSATALSRKPIKGAGAAYLAASIPTVGAANTSLTAGTLTPAPGAAGDAAKLVADISAAATLTRASVGSIVFTPDVAGIYVFTASGDSADPAVITITAAAPTASAVINGAKSRLNRADDNAVIAGFCATGTGATGIQFVSGPSDQTALTSGTYFPASAGVVTLTEYNSSNRTWEVNTDGTGMTNGTYTFRTYCDLDVSGTFNAADGTATTHTFTVADNAKGVGAIALSASTVSTDGTADAPRVIVTANVTDDSGVESYLISGEAMTLTMGALTATATATPGTGAIGFVENGLLGGSGSLFIDGAVAVGSYTVTLFGPGGAAADGATATLTVLRTGSLVTGMTAVGNANLVFDAANNGVANDDQTASTITASTAAGTITYNFSGATYVAGAQVAVTVTPSGTTGPSDLTAPANVAIRPDGTGTFTVTNAAPSTGDIYTVTLPTAAGNSGFTVTYAAPAPAWSAVSVSPAAAFTVKTASTNTVSAILANGFGVASAASSVTVTVAGRNPSTSVITTSATGLASFTLVDAGAVAAATTDTVTFSHPFINSLGRAATATTTFTITYTATGIVVGTVLVTAANATRTVDTVQALGVVGAGAITTYTATVADSAGIPLTAGNVVTWTGGASDMFVGGVQRSVTNSLGEATIRVYRNLVGLGTITATIGGVSASSNTVLWSNVAGDARNVVIKAEPASVVSAGTSTITATVTDRWGNPVPSIAVTFAELGAGRLSATAATTNTAGIASVDFISNAGETGSNTVSVRLDAAAQSLDLAGFVGAVAVTGVTAGNRTATTEMTITKDTSTSTADALLALAQALGTRDQASAALDSAAEATDAANAATDAANAAAEAADAATAAAQDAADAVAALSTQVSEMVNALKKQITSLTNLVIKIQRKVRA